MYLVKRKYIVKIIAFSIVFICILVGVYILTSKNNTNSKNQNSVQTQSTLNNICVSLENIDKAFEIGTDFSFTNETSKEIYANSEIIKSLLFSLEGEYENAITFFSDFSAYAKTDMTDNDKNSAYSQKIDDAKTVFINICTGNNYENIQNIQNEINDFFKSEKPREVYRSEYEQTEKEYSILNKLIISDRKETAELAKNILKHPFYLSQSKGNYKYPKTIDYSINNSYVNIFPSGNILSIMASEKNSAIGQMYDMDFLEQKALEYLNQYAIYASNCRVVFRVKNSSVAYFYFYPEIILNQKTILLYDNAIIIGVDTQNGQLKAYNADRYLKNIGKTEAVLDIPATIPPGNLNNYTIEQTNYAVFKTNKYIEYKIINNDKTYYYLTDFDNNKIGIYTESEYISRLMQ